MVAELKYRYANLLTSGAHLTLLFIGFHIDSPPGWTAILALISAISFFAWMGNLRRFRIIGDIPTSQIASAAQGYTELCGRAAQHPGFTLLSKLRGVPCVWFRYTIERKNSDNKWVLEDSGYSEDTFLLVDASGQCAIDADDAEVISQHDDTWVMDNHRYTETLLMPGDELYALGEFTTLSGANSELDFREDLNHLLGEWKRDQKQLHARFDVNRDSEIDAQEWNLAAAQAQQTVERQHRIIRLEGHTSHLLKRPANGRLFLLSNFKPDKLARKYRLWSTAHLGIFFAAGIAALSIA